MRVPMTEYLLIDLDTERWVCRVCDNDFGDARGNYKEGTLVYDRDPREIHQPIIDPDTLVKVIDLLEAGGASC